LKKFSLTRFERVKKKKDFEEIYNSNKVFFSKNNLLKSYILIKKEAENPGVKFAAAVSKKAGKAVWRNRIKRLLKESYRQNKQSILNKSIEKKISLFIIISPNRLSEKNNKNIYLHDISSAAIELIEKIEKKI